MTNEPLFTFPEAMRRRSHRSYPLKSGNKKISFAFIEVGCQHRKKRSQLKNKKELFLKYWGDTYKSTGYITWIPQIFRIMSHYNAIKWLPREHSKYSVDAIIYHKHISPEQLESLTDQDHISIYHTVKKQKEQELLEDILANNDAETLHKLIIEDDSKQKNQYGTLRGKMAEILTQQAIQQAIDNELKNGQIVSYRNGHIKYFNKKFDNGAEVDQVLQFYGEERYKNMIFELSKKDNLAISLDTQAK